MVPAGGPGISAGEHLTCFGLWFSRGQRVQAVGQVTPCWETLVLTARCKCGGVQGTGSNGLCQQVGELQGRRSHGKAGLRGLCTQGHVSGGGLTNNGQFDGSTRRLWGLAHLL